MEDQSTSGMEQGRELPASCSGNEPARADERRERRHILRVPIVAQWEADREYKVKGITRDLNDNGVFFYCHADLPLGAAVELRFTWARPFEPAETIHFTGTVVRVEPSANSAKGIAVQGSKSEGVTQQGGSQSKIPDFCSMNPPWFASDVRPRQIHLRQKALPEAQQHRASLPASNFEPKVLLEWEPRWRSFVTSVRPAIARSAARLESECDRTLARAHGPFTSLILHFLVVVLLFLPFEFAQSSRVRIQNPIGKGTQVIYFSGSYLPELQDRGGAQYGRSGASGGSESSTTQNIRVARGISPAKINVDSSKLYLPPSTQPVSNLLAMTPDKQGPSLADRVRSLFDTPAAPANESVASLPPKQEARAKSQEAQTVRRHGIRIPYRRVSKSSTLKKNQDTRPVQAKIDPAPAEQEGALGSVVRAISSALDSVTGATAPAVIVSTQPGKTLGLPTTPKSGALALSPEGSARGGLGGSGKGLGIGSGNGPGRAQEGGGSGASVADTGSGSDPFRGRSPSPGLGGAGKNDSDESNGVSIQGATVTVHSFGSPAASDRPLGRSRHPSANSESAPRVTVVASSRSGGAMSAYGAFRGTKVYSIYIATSLRPAVVQYSEHSPSGHGFENDLSAPEPISTELPSGFTNGRFVVACMIDRSGLLRNFRVLEGNTSEPVARIFSALEAWRFHPALRDTAPVEVDAILGFNLETH